MLCTLKAFMPRSPVQSVRWGAGSFVGRGVAAASGPDRRSLAMRGDEEVVQAV